MEYHSKGVIIRLVCACNTFRFSRVDAQLYYKKRNRKMWSELASVGVYAIIAHWNKPAHDIFTDPTRAVLSVPSSFLAHVKHGRTLGTNIRHSDYGCAIFAILFHGFHV